MDNPLSTQRLPIPVGAKYAQRPKRRPFRLHSLHLNRWFLVALIGLFGAITGALISTSPPSFPVSVSGSQDLQIQGFTLAHSTDPAGDDVYQSQYGAMVVTPAGSQIHSGTAVRTGGSTTLNGQAMTGNCTYTSGALQAYCSFTLGTRTLTSTDTWGTSGWDRRYSDGKEVKIAWSNPAFPLPFALGE